MGSVVRKITKPIRKVAKKIIPKEIKPFLPYAAAAFGAPYLSGSAFMSGVGNAALRNAISKGLISGATAAATDDDANILRSATLAAAPDLLQGGLGAAGSRLSGTANIVDEFAPTLSQDVGRLLTKAADSNIVNLAANPTQGSGLTQLMNVGKVAGAQASIDQAAKLAEINQDELDKYNEELRQRGVLDKTKRRSSIYNIYINAGYEPDYVNSMLDRYGYDEGGIVEALKALKEKMRAPETIAKQMKGNLRRKSKDDRATILPPKPKDSEDDDEGPVPVTTESDLASGLAAAASGIEKAFGTPFGGVEPVPMLRFAQGGEVEIEEETDDLNILDFMKDQGIEYGQQASNAQNDEILERLFEEYLELGFSPEDAAKKAREEFDRMGKGQGITGTQVASGYKTDIEEMYEQYVFEMEEQGLQPMSFSEFLAQARAGMAGGGKVRAFIKGVSTLKNNIMTRLGRMTDDVEIQTTYDDAIDTGPSMDTMITAKSRKGRKVLDQLVGEGIAEVDDGVYYIKDFDEGMMGLEESGIKASGAKLGTDKFTPIRDFESGLYESMEEKMIRNLNKKADGGDVKRRRKGEPADEIIETEEEIFLDTMPRPKRQGIMEAADGGRIGFTKGGDVMKAVNRGIDPAEALDLLKEYKRMKRRFGLDISFEDYLSGDMAKGGIAGMADGGIMEKEMRGGGFIPEGTKEKADDVPARLSKNEFVMTADAVRAAGGGSVNKGAKRMYDMMYSLEGKI